MVLRSHVRVLSETLELLQRMSNWEKIVSRWLTHGARKALYVRVASFCVNRPTTVVCFNEKRTGQLTSTTL